MEALIEQLQALLDDLDDLEITEDLSDLNATLEDVIFLLEEDPDARVDAAAELSDLQHAYGRLPGLTPYATRLAKILAENF